MKNIFLAYLILLSSFASAQNVGIGTPTPNANALLHVELGSSTTKGLLVTGLYNATSTIPDIGSGSRMMFYPGKGAFRAGYSDGTAWDNANVGFYSTATGYGTNAGGVYSTAIGYKTLAGGYTSTSMGSYTTAGGYLSTSMGFNTNAAGDYSTAMGDNTFAGGSKSTASGYNTKAKGFASAVLGMYNDSILLSNEGISNSITPLFIIGNGTADNARSNAMVVQKNGNVGIGNNLPNANALLHINTGSSTIKGILVTGTYNAASTVPDLGAGSRMMYYPGKAAFRAGQTTGTQWDNVNVGDYSLAMGRNTIGLGLNSVALGSNTSALGDISTVMGFSTTGAGVYSTAMGVYTNATGNISTAMGDNTYAGGSTSTAMGSFTKAKGFASVVMGLYNDSILLDNEVSVNTTTPLFIIGNGDANNLRSNAMVVQKNGNVGIGVSTPMSTLHVKGTANFFSGGNTRTGIVYNGTSSLNAIELVTAGTDAYISVQRSGIGAGLHLSKPAGSSGSLVSFQVNGSEVGNITTNGTTTSYNTTSDERLKENITSTQYGLSTILKLKVKDYNYIFDNRKSLQTGLLAQELYTVYPQAVKEGGADVATNPWMVDYSKLTAVLVKAVQELSQENNSLKQNISNQTNDILTLKKEMEQVKLLLKQQVQSP